MVEKQIEKQAIEEIASVLEQAKIDALATIGSMNEGFGMWYAKAIYNAGYRKQREGEWVTVYRNDIATVYECSRCHCLKFGTSDYCICGAHMKGGAE